MKNKALILRPVLAAAAAALVLLLCFRASRCDMLVLGVDRDAQKNIVPEFFSALQEEDYDRAMDFVANYETLGFEKNAGELVEFYRDKLVDSYSVRVIDHDCADTSGLTGQQLVELTVLDSRLLLAAINEKTAVTVTDFMYHGGQLESADQALSFVYDALYECLETPEDYYSVQQLTIGTEYDGKEWKIVIDDALLNAMSGYINGPFDTAVSAADVSSADLTAEDNATAEGDDLT